MIEYSGSDETFSNFVRQRYEQQTKIAMKKICSILTMLFCGVQLLSAQAQIKFDKVSHDFGVFMESNSVQTYTFTFTNTGDQPLVINQAVASCGCTTPVYTKTPVRPGEKGTVKVTYDGRGKFPGHFKKAITIRTNGTPEMTRLYVEGVMRVDENEK